MQDHEIAAMQAENIKLKSTITPDERQFVLDLITQARIHGITTLEYKGLKLNISPQAAERAAKQVYLTSNGRPAPIGWVDEIPKAR